MNSRVLLLPGNEQPEFAKIREDDVAIVGGDVEPVVTIEAGIRDRVGLQLEALGKRLVALRVERGPGGAVVGALELPVLRIAGDQAAGAGDRIALDALRVAEVILQPAGRAPV